MENKKKIEELKQLEEQQKQLEDKITDLKSKIKENNRYFSQWIARTDDVLAIKGEKWLKSTIQGDIIYTDRFNEAFNDEVSYKKGQLEDLKYGDIFIIKSNLNNIELEKFNIFIGKNNNGYYMCQHLYQSNGVERITYYSYYGDKDIIIFNRF